MQFLQKTTSQSLSQIGENILIETQTADYETRINRDRPACFVFLIDQSGSMKDNWGGDTSKSKASGAVTIDTGFIISSLRFN